jgi:hypothetical protein
VLGTQFEEVTEYLIETIKEYPVPGVSLLVVMVHTISIDPVMSTERILVSLHRLCLTVCRPIKSRPVF